jgi:hypothetical protein
VPGSDADKTAPLSPDLIRKLLQPMRYKKDRRLRPDVLPLFFDRFPVC